MVSAAAPLTAGFPSNAGDFPVRMISAGPDVFRQAGARHWCP